MSERKYLRDGRAPIPKNAVTSRIMSANKGKNTRLELEVFRALRRDGIYFQKHYRRASGSPDIALPKKKLAVFIDGDFWHGYKFAQRKKTLPKVYWRAKIETNIERDKRNRSKLRREGWRVLRIWEHEILKSKEKSVQKIKEFLDQ